jgi:hypothetical protein
MRAMGRMFPPKSIRIFPTIQRNGATSSIKKANNPTCISIRTRRAIDPTRRIAPQTTEANVISGKPTNAPPMATAAKMRNERSWKIPERISNALNTGYEMGLSR